MRLRDALIGSCLWMALARAAPGQLPRASASLSGTVVDDAGAPIQGVAVYALGARANALSAERGQFQLPLLTSGTYRVVARRTGYRPDTVTVDLAPDDSAALWIVLAPALTTLRGLVVDAAYTAPRLMAFEQRRLRSIGGRFITPREIEAQSPTETSDLLRRIPGVLIVDSSHVMVPISSRGTKMVQMGRNLVAVQCMLRLGLNGFLQGPNFTMNSISPKEIHGIEIYNGPASIPPEYNGVGTDTYCGLIMIWTKSG